MIYKTITDMMNAVYKKHPDAKRVPVCMGDTVHNIYADDKYDQQVATVLYADSNTGLWGYDYNLVWL